MEINVGALSEEADSSVKVQLTYLLEYVMFLTLATLWYSNTFGTC